MQSISRLTKRTKVDLYEVFCAVLYLLRTGCQSRLLPGEFPQMTHDALLICQMERIRPERHQRCGSCFKKIDRNFLRSQALLT